MNWRHPAEVLLRDQEDPELSDTSPAKISELQILTEEERRTSVSEMDAGGLQTCFGSLVV